MAMALHIGWKHHMIDASIDGALVCLYVSDP